jgi:hypothetical protein
MLPYASIEEAWGSSTFSNPKRENGQRSNNNNSINQWVSMKTEDPIYNLPKSYPCQKKYVNNQFAKNIPPKSSRQLHSSRNHEEAFTDYKDQDTDLDVLKGIISRHSYEGLISMMPPDMLKYLEHKYLFIDDKINTTIQLCLLALIAFAMMDCTFASI